MTYSSKRIFVPADAHRHSHGSALVSGIIITKEWFALYSAVLSLLRLWQDLKRLNPENPLIPARQPGTTTRHPGTTTRHPGTTTRHPSMFLAGIQCLPADQRHWMPASAGMTQIFRTAVRGSGTKSAGADLNSQRLARRGNYMDVICNPLSRIVRIQRTCNYLKKRALRPPRLCG